MVIIPLRVSKSIFTRLHGYLIYWFPDPPIKVEWSRQKNKCNRPTLFCALLPSNK